jgi:hypothetical protein
LRDDYLEHQADWLLEEDDLEGVGEFELFDPKIFLPLILLYAAFFGKRQGAKLAGDLGVGYYKPEYLAAQWRIKAQKAEAALAKVKKRVKLQEKKIRKQLAAEYGTKIKKLEHALRRAKSPRALRAARAAVTPTRAMTRAARAAAMPRYARQALAQRVRRATVPQYATTRRTLTRPVRRVTAPRRAVTQARRAYTQARRALTRPV